MPAAAQAAWKVGAGSMVRLPATDIEARGSVHATADDTTGPSPWRLGEGPGKTERGSGRAGFRHARQVVVLVSGRDRAVQEGASGSAREPRRTLERAHVVAEEEEIAGLV